ncbi:MAG: fumarate hydratase subunit alpha [Clostridia bacterium]|nr:fumarate hydratase subunit alpha [Clostridia bacterium]
MAISEQLIQATAEKLLTYASIDLPADVKRALNEAYSKEEDPAARSQMEAIFKNIELAHQKRVGLCQDTGVPLFFLKLGLRCQITGDPERALTRAVEKATREVPLRQNVIHPLTKKNSGTNTGWGIPYCHWEVVPDQDYLEITAVPKGFGSEMRAAISWVLTSEEVDRAVVKAVLDIVEDAMGEPCPPVIIGIGIGGFADSSMLNAKKALFRNPIGSHHPDPKVATLEEEIYRAVNSLGLGPIGLGGKTYCLGVHIEINGSHTAVIPISVIYQCWACRYSTARIYNDGRVAYLTHGEGDEQHG